MNILPGSLGTSAGDAPVTISCCCCCCWLFTSILLCTNTSQAPLSQSDLELCGRICGGFRTSTYIAFQITATGGQVPLSSLRSNRDVDDVITATRTHLMPVNWMHPRNESDRTDWRRAHYTPGIRRRRPRQRRTTTLSV